MANTNGTDNNDVKINVEHADEESESASDLTPVIAAPEAKPVSPIVPDLVNQPTDEARPNNTSRGRQLKPGGTNPSVGRSRSGSRSPNRRARRDTEAAQNDAIPLLPLDAAEGRQPRQRPPLAGPEMDIDGPDAYDPSDRRGIDDGFLPEKPGLDDDQDRDASRRIPGGRGNNAPRAFPYPPGYGPGIEAGVPYPPVNSDGTPRVIPDVNVYQQKKNLAQGMMDLALLSANANQLRYVLESYSRHPYFYFSLVFISTSIIAQVAVGIGLIWKSRYNIKNQDDFCKADRINNMVTIGIFIITLVNVLISAFGVADPPKPA